MAQLARAAEVETLQLQHHSAPWHFKPLLGALALAKVVPLVTWANATAWMALALPYMTRRGRCSLVNSSAGAPKMQAKAQKEIDST